MKYKDLDKYDYICEKSGSESSDCSCSNCWDHSQWKRSQVESVCDNCLDWVSECNCQPKGGSND